MNKQLEYNQRIINVPFVFSRIIDFLTMSLEEEEENNSAHLH